MAHFRFPAGETTPAIRHRTVDELWYVLSGRGVMWTSDGEFPDGFPISPGTCVFIPVGTVFQVRTEDEAPLEAVGATMPPWPGDGEADVVVGPWEPTLEPGPH